jgi:hypothetical protein
VCVGYGRDPASSAATSSGHSLRRAYLGSGATHRTHHLNWIALKALTVDASDTLPRPKDRVGLGPGLETVPCGSDWPQSDSDFEDLLLAKDLSN